MTKTLSTIRFISLLLLITLVPGCKCTCDDPTDPDCKNYDPCYGVEASIRADFSMYLNIDPISTFGPDTLLKFNDTFNGGTIVFRAHEENADSYEWHVGSGVYSEREFSLNFYTAPDSTSIPVTLTVRKKPNYACQPEEDSVLTSERILYKSGGTTGAYEGKWAGYYLDTTSFRDTLLINRPNVPYQYGVYGIFPKFDSVITSNKAFLYAWYFESGANQNKSDMYFRGYCFVNSTKDSISFYWEQESPRDVLDWPGQRTFVGWRIE